MTLVEYMTLKYGRPGFYVLNGKEARYLGMKYPLVKGWVHRYGARELSDEDVAAMMLFKKSKRWFKRNPESRGRVLSGAIDERLEPEQRSHLNEIVGDGLPPW